MSDLKAFFKTHQTHIDQVLLRYLPDINSTPKILHESMHYSVLNGGKRFRPILVYAVGKTQNINTHLLDACASSIELIHSYSLIHDDLPAMDDDNLRRGKETCHIRYDEATAILAGDAIQAYAFDVLLNHLPDKIPSDTKIEVMKVLAQASGSSGMAGGQAIDLASANKTISLNTLENMHQKKTGALIKACVSMANLCCNITDKSLFEKLENYAHYLGLNFQITDDILDIESDTQMLGKPQGSDIKQNKSTFPSLLGMDKAKQYAQQTHQAALDELQGLPNSYNILRDISFYILNRNH